MSYELIMIGTSLGGLEAVRRIFEKLPDDFYVPIVLIQHREKDSDDTLQILIESYSNLIVIEPNEKDKIERGKIYIAPPNYHLLIEEDHFAFTLDEPVHHARPSIDVSFESAAEYFGKKVIGIILTGMNSDGANGLKKIKQAGGFTIVQDPLEAEAPAMPNAAIRKSKPDKILQLEEISDFLVELCEKN